MLAYVEAYEKQYQEILRAQSCLTLKELAVKGSDLMEAGIQPGREMGEALEYLLELVLEHPEYNTKEILLEKLSERA